MWPRHVPRPVHQPLAVAVDEETFVATRQLLFWPVVGNAITRAAGMRIDTPKAKLFVAKPSVDWHWHDRRSAQVLRPNLTKDIRAASRYDLAAKWWADQMDHAI